jgi:hypothetical protein
MLRLANLISIYSGVVCASFWQYFCQNKARQVYIFSQLGMYNVLPILKKLINNSRGKYKRNECLINVCKSDTDLS